uniref:Uncharacterized protein n=1 Tax=Arundo donax TaxID=35708 RepID=A0A0A9HKX0_ARUDO
MEEEHFHGWLTLSGTEASEKVLFRVFVMAATLQV